MTRLKTMWLRAVRRSAFDSLATGADDSGAVSLLRCTQYDRRVLLLRGVLDRAARRFPEVHRSSDCERAYGVLASLQRSAPDVVRDTLLHPQVGGWAARALRDMVDADADAATVEANLLHLGAVAASAAIRAGQSCRLSLGVHQGRVALPLLGTAELPSDERSAPGEVEHSAHGTVVRCRSAEVRLPGDPTRPAPGWRPFSRVTTRVHNLELAVTVDDADPYRNYHGLTPAENLPTDAIDRWRRQLEGAWTILVQRHPVLARSIAAGLTSIVPLVPSRGGVSGTSADAFGAAALSLPEGGTQLAVALVHEFQHSKLAALLHVTELCEPDGGGLYYAPWRNDPRPLTGLLHGCYAHLGIADFWRIERLVPGPDSGPAHFAFARWREQAWRTALQLLETGALTPAGRRFVAHMARTLAEWRTHHVPPAPLAAANSASQDHRLTWQLRNLFPDPDAVAALADDYVASRYPHGSDIAQPSNAIRPGSFTPLEDPRTRLWRWRLREPGKFEPDVDSDVLATAVDGATVADVDLVRGRHAAAAQGYRRAIGHDPADNAAWSGLALAGSALDARAALALHRAPELVRAVYLEVRSSTANDPDPFRVARWLTPVVVDA